MAETEPLSFFVKLDGPSGPTWQQQNHTMRVQQHASMQVYLER